MLRSWLYTRVLNAHEDRHRCRYHSQTYMLHQHLLQQSTLHFGQVKGLRTMVVKYHWDVTSYDSAGPMEGHAAGKATCFTRSAVLDWPAWLLMARTRSFCRASCCAYMASSAPLYLRSSGQGFS